MKTVFFSKPVQSSIVISSYKASVVLENKEIDGQTRRASGLCQSAPCDAISKPLGVCRFSEPQTGQACASLDMPAMASRKGIRMAHLSERTTWGNALPLLPIE